MKATNSVIISMQFYPVEGGVETFLLEVAKKWENQNIEVWCREHHNTPNHINTPVKILRFPWGQGSYLKTIKLLYAYLKSSAKPILFLMFCSLLLINRNVIKSCISFIDKSLSSFNQLRKQNKNNHLVFQCSMPLFTGVIGTFYKLCFNVPLVIYVHGSELIFHSKPFNQRLLQKFILKNADLIISNSKFTTQLAISKGADPNKIYKTLLGANTKMFFPKETNHLIKQKYNIPDDHLILLTVSHLVPRKGNDMVIKALPKILENVPNLTYLIGGRGEYQSTLIHLVKENKLENHVKFIGFVQDEEINDLFNACDIFIMPNRQEDYDVEGFGIVFADAAACAKPTIAGNSGGAVDAIVDKQTGFLVNPLSIEDIAEKTITLLKDPQLRQQFGQKGLERVQKELNWDIVAKKIYNRIHDLANEKD